VERVRVFTRYDDGDLCITICTDLDTRGDADLSAESSDAPEQATRGDGLPPEHFPRKVRSWP
jgi:hypothetical protein